MAERTHNRQKRKRSTVVPWLVILSLFVAELFFYTWCRVQSMKTGYTIAGAMERQKALVKLEKDLTIELAHLRSPQRLSALAQKRFRLQMPTPEQVIEIP